MKVKRKNTGRPSLVAGDQTIRVGFTVPEGFWARVVRRAKQDDVSFSVLIRRALVAYLED